MSGTEKMATPQYVVPPVQRAFHLLRYIAEGNRCQKLSEAVTDTGLNRTTLIRLLQTLVDERALEKRDDGYHLGIGLIGLAGDALFSNDIVEHARGLLDRLTREAELSSHLGILDGPDIVYLVRATPNMHLISNVRVGSRMPAHATSIGRIILAHMPEDDVRALFEGVTFDRFTPKTSTTIEQLMKQVRGDRQLGLAWSYSNFEQGLGSCAAAVFDHTGQPVAGINVTGHESHFVPDTKRREEVGELVHACARTLSGLLGGASFVAGERTREGNEYA